MDSTGDAGALFGRNGAGSELAGLVIHTPYNLGLFSRAFARSGETKGGGASLNRLYTSRMTVQHTFANHAAARIALRCQSTTTGKIL